MSMLIRRYYACNKSIEFTNILKSVDFGPYEVVD